MSARPVPTDLCYALQQGQLCYVSRVPPTEQLLLCAHTRDEMESRGYRSCVIHLSALSDRQTDRQTDRQYAQIAWDKYLITALWPTFYPKNQIRLAKWFKTTESLSAGERLIQFTNDLLLSELCEAPITILIDTIDPLVAIPAAVYDLFAWIDHCYELRDTYLSYHHLSFAVFGQLDLFNLDSFNFDRSKMTHIQASSGYLKSFRVVTSMASMALCNRLSSHAQLHQDCRIQPRIIPIG